MHLAIRAVLFDLDGTLLDTLDDLAGAMNRVLAARGLPGHPVDAYRRFVGDGVAALVERALPASARTPEALASTTAALRDEYARSWAVRTRPYPGIPELLDALVARGLPLAVLSNKPHDAAAAMGTHFLARWPFVEVRGLRDGAPRKPDPAQALELAAALGAEPAACAFVGDSAVDVLTARRAGMRAVGVAWGFRGEDELREAGAEAVLHEPRELLALVDRYNLGSKANG
jgi:phosphoglycolate phosphatase